MKEWSRTASVNDPVVPIQKVDSPARSHKNENKCVSKNVSRKFSQTA